MYSNRTSLILLNVEHKYIRSTLFLKKVTNRDFFFNLRGCTAYNNIKLIEAFLKEVKSVCQMVVNFYDLVLALTRASCQISSQCLIEIAFPDLPLRRS